MINLAELVDVLTKDQIGQFLQLRGTARTAKGELAQKLLMLLAADELAKDRFFEAFKRELAVPPWEVEVALGCTPTERKRWVADGNKMSWHTLRQRWQKRNNSITRSYRESGLPSVSGPFDWVQ